MVKYAFEVQRTISNNVTTSSFSMTQRIECDGSDVPNDSYIYCNDVFILSIFSFQNTKK